MSGGCWRVALLTFLAGSLHAGPLTPLTALTDKSFGVLLLGDGGDKDWKDALAAFTKKLSPQFPLAFAPGEADAKAIQKAVDRLQAARVKKLVVVPLYVTSDSPLMDETRFLFGIRKDPSPEFFRAEGAVSGYAIVRRVQTKVPVVLTQALDDHPLVVEVLTSRALSLSRHASDEALVVVGLAPVAGPVNGESLGRTPAAKPATAEDEYRQTLSALAERVRAKGGFKTGHAAVLQPQALHQSERERHEGDLRKLVRELSRSQRVLVVPHAVTGEIASRTILRALQGTFMRYTQKGLLPDDRIVRWVEETARQGATLPDMKVFKDAGRPLPAAGKFMRGKFPRSFP